MPYDANPSQNKILIFGPESELKQKLIEKLTDSGMEISPNLPGRITESDTVKHIIYLYNIDSKSPKNFAIKNDFHEKLDLVQLLSAAFTLVVNIDPFLELDRKNDKVILPQKYTYFTSSDYDSVYPLETVTALAKAKKIKSSIIKIANVYSNDFRNQKSIIDYFLLQAIDHGSIILPQNHDQYIHPTHLNDVCFGITRTVLGFKKNRQTYLLNPNAVSLTSLAKTIKDEFYKNFYRTVKIGIHNSQILPQLKISGLDIDTDASKINWSAKGSLIQTISDFNLAVSRRKAKSVQVKKRRNIYLYLTIGLIFLILSPIIFVIFNTSSALLDIKLIHKNIQTKNFSQALMRANYAESKFKRNLVVYNFLSFSPPISDKIFLLSDLKHFSQSGIYLSRTLESAIETLKITDPALSKINSSEASGSAIFNSDVNSQISSVNSNLQLAVLESEKISGKLFSDKILKYQSTLAKYSQITQHALALFPIIPEIIGGEESKKYLILNLNNNELRPGGGFIGSYSTLDFTRGKFSNLTVGDIYDIDGQLNQIIPAPAPLVDNLGVTSWFLRDANWDPDFKTNYPVIKEFYRKETGQSINGVIALDLEFIKSVLKYTGPINLEDYNETVTEENISQLGQKYSEVDFFPGSKQKKNFFSSLSRKLVDRIVYGQKYLDPEFLMVLDDSLIKQSMQIYIENDKVYSSFDSLGLTGEVPGRNYQEHSDKTYDYLMIVDANVGANKSNAYLSKKIDYSVSLDKNGNLLSSTQITYTNSSPNNSWPAGDYKNYLRVFVPHGSKLESVIFDSKDITSQFSSFDDSKLTFFAGQIQIPFSTSRTLEIKYTQPKGLDPQVKTNDYVFYYQKQAGTYDIDFNYQFNYPEFITLRSPVQSVKFAQQTATFSAITDTSLRLEFQTVR